MRRLLFLSALPLLIGVKSSAQNVSLVADIEPGSSGSSPVEMAVYNGELFFRAYNSSSGIELWSYDGTTASLVSDIDPSSSNPRYMTVYNGELYFNAYTYPANGGEELWSYDGTTASIASDIYPGDQGTPKYLTVYNGNLYFSARNASYTDELFKFDGSSTSLAADIWSGGPSSPTDLTVYNGNLYFSAYNSTYGNEMWKYNGSSATVIDINTGSGSSLPQYYFVYNSKLYFTTQNSTIGTELWSYDGTTASLAADINSGSGSSSPNGFTEYNGDLYFIANDGTTGNELWKFDGTTASLAADIRTGSASSNPNWLTAFDGKLYFMANDGITGAELWSYDGVSASLVADIRAGGSSSPSNLIVFNNALYFNANDGSSGAELWKLDVPPALATWTGATNTDWHTSSNWDINAVPDNCATSIIIPNTTNNPVLASTVTVGDIDLQANAQLTLNADLNVCGNFTGGSGTSSTVTGNNSLILNGSSAQTVGGLVRFEYLQLDNSSGASLLSGADVSLNNALELKAGTLTTTSGSLTFLSTSETHCAIIDNFSSGFSGTISGNVTAQRYHATAVGTFDQHLMGSPINSGAFSSFTTISGTDGVAVTPTGDCDETQLDPSSNYGNIFEWNEALVSSCHLEGWVVRSSGGMSNGRGYGVAIVGAGTVSVTGAPNLNTSYTQTGLNNSSWSTTSLQGNPYVSGWHLLSNPYLASFDLDGAANSAFDNFVQVMNTHGGFAGTYQPLSMSSSALLPPFQAFMVRKTNAGAGTFTFNAFDRSLGTAAFHKVEALEGSMEILVEGNSFADITYLQFDPASTTAYDPQFDAYKFLSAPGHPTIYTTVGTDWLSINTNPDVASAPVVPMGFRPGANGSFTFTAQQMNLPVGVTAILEDVQLNVFQNLNTNPTYTFASQVSDNPDRFNVHFSNITDVEDLLVEDVHTWSNGTQVFVRPLNLEEQATVNVFDATGRLLHTSNVQPNIQTTIDLTHKATGVVIVQVTTSKNAYSQKVIINQ